MRKLAAHVDTLGVMVVLCPLAGVGAGLAFDNAVAGFCVALGAMAIVGRLAPGRALATTLQTPDLPPSLSDLARTVAIEAGRGKPWTPRLWDPEVKSGRRRIAELTH